MNIPMDCSIPHQNGGETPPKYIEVFLVTERGKKNNLDVKKFSRFLPVKDLKWRIEVITGRNSKTMSLTLLDKANRDICKLNDDDSLFGSYPVESGMALLIEDPAYKNVFDENTVDRFQLTDEQYANRKGTLKEFLMKNKLIKRESKPLENAMEEELIEEKLFDNIEIGERCEVSIPGQPVKRGVVMFKGPVKFQNGLWIGVMYDEPVGKNNGSVNGIQYFEAPNKYGGFVKACHVKTGDFPEICELDGDTEF